MRSAWGACSSMGVERCEVYASAKWCVLRGVCCAACAPWSGLRTQSGVLVLCGQCCVASALRIHAPTQVVKKKVAKGLPSLRVVQAAQQYAYSKQNALLALNLLLFEVIRYEPRDRGKGV